MQVPQLIENHRAGNAAAISLTFLTVWLLGDLANLCGAVWAGLVPIAIVLAVYFCIADMMLISQCLYYRCIITRGQQAKVIEEPDGVGANQPLLGPKIQENGQTRSVQETCASDLRCDRSIDAAVSSELPIHNRSLSILMRNLTAIVVVGLLGVLGWLIAWKSGIWKPLIDRDDHLDKETSIGASMLGYLSAILYLGYFRLC